MSEIQFEIIKSYGTVSEEKSGWRKEFNLVAWNGRTPKFDLREWSPDHQKMGKGVTLTREEAEGLSKLLAAALAAPEA
jgi:hypothetical protein